LEGNVKNTLLLEIASCCKEFKNYVEGKCTPCGGIFESQKGTLNSAENNEIRLPTPWCGHIAENGCRILFISSNPSVSHDEFSPSIGWNADKISSFSENRFDDGYNWTNESEDHKHNHYLIKNGDHSKKPVSYWNEIRKRAEEIHDLETKIFRFHPGQYYALTELVHCQSVNKNGVKEALGVCADRYLFRILDEAKAKVIVLVDSDVIAYFNTQVFSRYGKIIRLYFKSRVFKDEIPDLKNPRLFPLKIDSLRDEKMFLSLATANSRGKRKIKDWSEYEIQELRTFLADN
jgi:hypothetical protein